jgi:ankyrin repeat protein
MKKLFIFVNFLVFTLILYSLPNHVHNKLKEKRNLSEELIKAIKSPDSSLSTIEALLKQGADPNFTNENNQTALSTAFDADKPEFFQILVKAGANPNTRNSRGLSLLHRAVLLPQDYHMIQPLIDGGANVNEKTPYGVSPLKTLLYLAKNQETPAYLDTVHTLLKAGTEVSDENGFSEYFHLAAKKNLPKTIRLLAEHSTQNKAPSDALININDPINIPDKHSYDTPLHTAVRMGNVEAATALIKAGAALHQVGGDYEIPIETALKNKHAELSKALILAGEENFLTKTDKKNIKKNSELQKVRLYNKALKEGVISPDLTMLQPGVSRKWNYSDTPATLKEQMLSKLTQDYFNGHTEPLEHLISDPHNPPTIKHLINQSFSENFLQGVRKKLLRQQAAKESKALDLEPEDLHSVGL